MIGRSHHAQRRRRWFAATACVLWLLGVEVLPDLHLAFHADDHTHSAEGTIVHAAAHGSGRDHGSAHAEHAHEHAHHAPVMLAAAPASDLLAPAHEAHAHALAADDAEPAALVWRAPVAAGDHDEHDHHAAPARAHDAHDAHHAHHAHRSHRSHRERSDGAATLDLAPSAHTAAGVAHHAIALHRPPPPLLEPLPVPRAAWQLEREPAPQLHDALRTRPNARGPPAAA